jgi:hypothetical protein
MMKNVIENQKRESRRDNRETTIKRIDVAKVTPEKKAPRAKQKQQSPDRNHNQRPPRDVPRTGFI